jgi:predicted transcriptional regulator
VEEVIRSYYAVIPANVRYDSNIPANAKLLYGEITALCNEKGYCWASNAYFAELYGVSKTSVSNWISGLQKQGYVSVEIVYKENSKEIESRYIKIVNDPIKENLERYPKNLNDPIQKNCTGNSTNKNTTLENTQSKDCGAARNPIKDSLAQQKKTRKAKDMVTMRNMISAFTANEDVQDALKQYFNIRVKKGLLPEQWQIILDDLRKFAGTDSALAIKQIDNATAGGYMQIVAAWNKGKAAAQQRTKFDNTAGHTAEAVVNMTAAQRKEFEDSLAKDEQGNLLKF